MNKILQVLVAIFMGAIIAVGFVGCGESKNNNNEQPSDQGKALYSNEVYYDKLLDSVSDMPTSYTIVFSNSLKNSTASGEAIENTNEKYLKDGKKNRYYNIVSTDNGLEGDGLEQSSVEKWIHQAGASFVEYTKETETGREAQLSAKQVSSDHVINYNGVTLQGLLLDCFGFEPAILPDTYDEFRFELVDTLEEALSFLGIETNSTEPNLTMTFSTLDSIHTLDCSLVFESDGGNFYLTFAITYSDTIMQSITFSVQTSGGENAMESSGALQISNVFDSEQYVAIDNSEFAGVEVDDVYYSENNIVYINGHRMGDDIGIQYNGNVLSVLEQYDTLYDLGDAISVSWFLDSGYTQPVTSETLKKSYDQNFYARVNVSSEYALIIVSGVNVKNDYAFITQESRFDIFEEIGHSKLDKIYQNGVQVVAPFIVEPGLIYYLELIREYII